MSEKHTFSAHVICPTEKDETLVVALPIIEQTSPIERYRASRLTGDIVRVDVTFWDEQGAATMTARLVAEALSRRWPTDTVRLDGRGVKYHGNPETNRDSLLQAAKDSGHLQIIEVD